jgi:CRP/FNR family cyclic AMP-dependent transcriptional regulator
MNAPYGFELRENCQTCTLQKTGFFCHVSDAALSAFERTKFTSSYPAGAVLFVEGQSPRGVYMICKGRVKMMMSSADGKTMIVRFGEAGEMLGLHSSVSGEPYELTAETLEPCQINFVRREDFLKLLHEHPEMYANAAQQLSGAYRIACQQIRCLGLSHSAAEKLAGFLLESAKKGQETKQGVRFHLSLTHEEIAQIVGVSRETVTRGLSELRSKMLISTSGPNVVIRNKPGLEAIVAA